MAINGKEACGKEGQQIEGRKNGNLYGRVTNKARAKNYRIWRNKIINVNNGFIEFETKCHAHLKEIGWDYL